MSRFCTHFVDRKIESRPRYLQILNILFGLSSHFTENVVSITKKQKRQDAINVRRLFENCLFILCDFNPNLKVSTNPVKISDMKFHENPWDLLCYLRIYRPIRQVLQYLNI